MIERNTFIEFGITEEPSIDYLLGIMEDARTTTLQRVSNLEKEEIHWQFAEGWNTIGALLSHIISCENYFRIYFIEGRELTIGVFRRKGEIITLPMTEIITKQDFFDFEARPEWNPKWFAVRLRYADLEPLDCLPRHLASCL